MPVPDITSFRDIHTHRPDAPADCVISIEPADEMLPDRWYSIGVHPWHTDAPDIDSQLEAMERLAASDRVVAIGECGIDALRGAPVDVQERIFRRHVAVSEALGKPLVIHAVKSHDRLLALRRELKPRQRWIIHGFRGKPQQAQQLLAAGFDLSLGQKYNELTLSVIPPERLFRETD